MSEVKLYNRKTDNYFDIASDRIKEALNKQKKKLF